MNWPNLFIAIAAVGAIGFCLALMVGLAFADEPSVCPADGGDLVEWTETRRINGFTYAFTMRGCPKIRDAGAGSPEYRSSDHFARVVKSRRLAKHGEDR